MPALSPPAPVNPTAGPAQYVPGNDPAPIIAAQEQSLQEFLTLPVREILSRLGIPAPAEAARAEGDPPAEAQPEAAPTSPMDPSALISPVTDALGTLGTGLFEGMDPTAMFEGISQVFQSTGQSLQQSVGAVDDAWKGASGAAAAAKTVTAIGNGAEVSAQANALRTSLATAAADVAQAQARLIAIITDFQATIAAIGPSIIFPWGWAAAIAAASKAIAMTAEAMTELQGSLGAQAAKTTAEGAPVAITAASPLAASPLAGLASPLLSMASQGAMAGVQVGIVAASSASEAAAKPVDPAEATPTGDPVPLGATPVGGAGGLGGGGVGGGGGAAGAFAPRSIPTSSMVQAETTSSPGQPGTARTAGGAGGMGMMGAPYGPMSGAGQGANASSNIHSAAPFLHTTEQGGEIVGDLGTAAPPVLGEADPSEPPDLELRI